MTTPVAFRSPLNHWHLAHGARLVDVDGWQMPTESPNQALADLSHVAKTRFLGAGSGAIVEALAAPGTSLRPGQVAPMAGNETTLLCRLRDDHLLVLSANATDAVLNQRFAELLAHANVSRWDVTTALACFAYRGPHPNELLAQLTHLNLATALPSGACAETSFAGVTALLVRDPDGPSAALRICVAWDVAEYAWERLVHLLPAGTA